ncbi:hypothetical protein KsCSTR_43550 [Candidatus Kuenenia stuttgartiensis]|uniref:Uncharacterized protein n=1 Tax=Kuenenia stuttgartiensis TaxID=174633 RepID=Q1PX21_KUEST|nr:hypothetical protein KsCSTR_43550 [Candidatus Kuenenia stuttgartiensis]CAJ71779.1 unknown protein [Candidatus Kuenenia stuttgartiensis]
MRPKAAPSPLWLNSFRLRLCYAMVTIQTFGEMENQGHIPHKKHIPQPKCFLLLPVHNVIYN